MVQDALEYQNMINKFVYLIFAFLRFEILSL